tara:strand:- start:35 stop:331 length:297 start_codon:yes stop_codon:yes gene_type:complete
MIDKINGHRFSLGVTIAIGTQVVAGLLYFNSLVTTLDQTAEQVEELTTLTQQLNGRLTRIEFDSQRNYSLTSFQSDILKEEIERLEGDIKVIEQSLFR